MKDPWILCVDDDERLLSGLELQLELEFEVRTATGGEAGLRLLSEDDNCALIISDMRMPGMNGTRFLKESREISPDSTRMLLTGFSDIDDAIGAINEGGVFRFLTKPIAPKSLLSAAADGVRQWELLRSERVLLEQTLRGAANALVEVLELSSPSIFGGVRRIESACTHLATVLETGPVWAVGLAGLLFRIGWISVPANLIEKYLSGEPLTNSESVMLSGTGPTTVRLISHIPRLEGVCSIIEAASDPEDTVNAATIVAASSEFDRLVSLNRSGTKTLKEMAGRYPQDLLEAFTTWEGIHAGTQRREVQVHQICEGMIIEEDVLSLSESLLVKTGTEMTSTIVQRLQNFAGTQGVIEPLIVSFKTQ